MNGQISNNFFIMEYFSYIKSLHIIFVITWFAGLFYIPRLFIYFIEASSKPSPNKKILMDQFIIMMNRLWFIITWPSSVLAILFGFWMVILVPNWLLENWMIAKLGFVFLVPCQRYSVKGSRFFCLIYSVPIIKLFHKKVF